MSSAPEIQFRVECRKVRFERLKLKRVLRRLLAEHGRTSGLLSIAVVDDKAIHALNREFLEHDEPTDVITFPLDDDAEPFGEIVLSAETAHREANARGIESERELALYAIHGALHLVGYDDTSSAERRKMKARERRYLGVFDGDCDSEDVVAPPPIL